MMLRADGRDLDRAHQRSDPSRSFPVDAAVEPVYEARAISVPAAGRVNHGHCANCGNLDAAITGVYRRSFGAARYYIGRDTRRKCALTARVETTLDVELCDAICARRGGRSPSLLFATVANAWLARVSGAQTTRLGVPLLNRAAGAAGGLGLFIEVVPNLLRVHVG